MPARRIAAIVVVITVALSGLVYTQAAFGADPRLRACGGDSPDVKVRMSFTISHARDFQAHYPYALKTPELETDGPAYVVDFEGPVNVRFTGNPRAQPRRGPYTNVVCVFADGVPNWYYDVDKTGMRP